jgi:hypothetical protein
MFCLGHGDYVQGNIVPFSMPADFFEIPKVWIRLEDWEEIHCIVHAIENAKPCKMRLYRHSSGNIVICLFD